MPPISPIMMIDFGRRVGQEQLEHVDEVGALDRVAADADAVDLAEAGVGGLAHGFVGERARARDDADRARLVDVARHDADLALARRDDAGQFGPMRRDFEPVERALHLAPCRAPGCPR